MTNRIALALIALIAVFLAVDHFVFDGVNTLFLGRKLIDLIEWLAFWR